MPGIGLKASESMLKSLKSHWLPVALTDARWWTPFSSQIQIAGLALVLSILGNPTLKTILHYNCD